VAATQSGSSKSWSDFCQLTRATVQWPLDDRRSDNTFSTIQESRHAYTSVRRQRLRPSFSSSAFSASPCDHGGVATFTATLAEDYPRNDLICFVRNWREEWYSTWRCARYTVVIDRAISQLDRVRVVKKTSKKKRRRRWRLRGGVWGMEKDIRTSSTPGMKFSCTVKGHRHNCDLRGQNQMCEGDVKVGWTPCPRQSWPLLVN